MKGKFKTTKSLALILLKTNRNDKNKKAYVKCYIMYIWKCLINSEDSFYVSFNGKYILNLFERTKNWLKYLFNKEEIPKPVHIVIKNAPSEEELNEFLSYGGLEVKGGIFYPITKKYIIGKK